MLLFDHGIQSTMIFKVNEGRPHVVDALKNQDIHMAINTPSNQISRYDDTLIRQESYKLNIPLYNNGRYDNVEAMQEVQQKLPVCSLQVYYEQV